MSRNNPIVTCENHAGVEAAARCLICSVPLCGQCAVAVGSRHTCAVHVGILYATSGDEAKESPHPDFTTRALAYLTDAVLLLNLGSLLLSLVMFLLRPAVSFDVALLTHMLLFAVCMALYTTYFISVHGQTPGQALFYLSVLDVSGQAVKPRQAFKRWIGYVICTLSLFYGFLSARTDRSGRGWHDRFAGTIVVGPSLPLPRKIRIGAILALFFVLESMYAMFTVVVR